MPARVSKTKMIYTASIFDKDRPQGRIIAVTRGRPNNWKHESKPIFAPSWRLLKEFKDGYITEPQFTERYLNEMRHLYKTTTILQSFAKECMEGDVVLCCYCKQETFCHRNILKDILENIIESFGE